jgi:hypothetical protein
MDCSLLEQQGISVMGHRDKIFALVALAVSALALAGVLGTDDYSRAAQAEATGFDALSHLSFSGQATPADAAAQPGQAGGVQHAGTR